MEGAIESAVYEGRQRRGDIWVLPAGCSGRFRWDDPGQVMMFVLDPKLLQRVALETDDSNSDKVQLLPALYVQDPTIEAFARSFHAEIQHMTQSYFCTLFKQSVGVTPHQLTKNP